MQEHLASIAGAQRQLEKAESLFDVAVKTYQKVDGSESRTYAEGLYHFAHFYAATEQFAKAERVLIELLQLAEKEIDVAELEKADYIQVYAHVLEQLGRTEEANEHFKRVEEIWAKESLES
jgi:tetratricopeptide (TPR) repeat protein